jgi:hypothetical protein
VNSQVEREAREGWGFSSAMKRHLELEITSFQVNSKEEEKEEEEEEVEQNAHTHTKPLSFIRVCASVLHLCYDC